MPIAGSIYYFASKQAQPDQPAIVLIHGAGGNHLHWPHQLRRLKSYRVFAPDLPGHGKSSGLGEQAIDKYAAVVADWMAAIELEQAVIVGHSMGGAIAQTMAVQFPQLVSKLVLISTGAVLSVNTDLLHLLSTPASTPAAIDSVVKWSYARGTDEKLLEQARTQLNETRTSVIYGDYLACNNFNLTAELPNISTSTLVLCGEMDKMTPPDLSKQLAANIPHATLSLFPGGGHMLMLEQPEAVASALADFVGE